MAQAQLNLRDKEGDEELVEEEEILAIKWSDEAVGTRYVNSTTEHRMEVLLSNRVSTGRCLKLRSSSLFNGGVANCIT